MSRAELTDVTDIRRYLVAGNSTVTLESAKTGQHYTFRLKRFENQNFGTGAHVSVLTGPDNNASYSYIGTYRDGRPYHHNLNRSQLALKSPSVKAFAWFVNRLKHGILPPTLKVYHEGRCGKCGRKLTTPESIQSGLGPVCAGRAS